MLKKVNVVVNFLFSTLIFLIICYIFYGEKMKKIFRSISIPVLGAILCGYILGIYIYQTYRNNIYNNLRSSKLYLIENGEYDTIDVMREENIGNNYIYYEDGNKYNSVIGITKEYENVDKIKELYGNNLTVKEYYVSSDLLSKKQDEYDKLLEDAKEIGDVREVVNNILELYHTENSIRLVDIN